MSRIRLSASASMSRTEDGVMLRSDLGTFQLNGRDVGVFVSVIAPLLDGSHDRDGVAEALTDYSRESVLEFLRLLEHYGLLEALPEIVDMDAERWRGQHEFFRKWVDSPDEPARLLHEARVLLVGLEPWGVVAAAELAASGVGALHLLDDRQVTQDDLISVRIWNESHIGRSRGHALAERLAATAPWCRISIGAPTLTDARRLALDDTRWDLIIGAVAGDELLLLASLARFAYQAGVVSLTGHLDGLDAVVGPAVVPGQTACWNCCRLRLLGHAEHLQSAHELHATLLAERPASRLRTYLAPMAPLLGHLLALEALKLLSRYTPSRLVGRLLIQNMVSLESEIHTVIRMPWCEICGGASGRGAPPGGPAYGNQSHEQIAPKGGVWPDQIDTPESVRALFAGWVDQRTGVIRHLAVNMPDAAEPELPITATAALASYTEGINPPITAEPTGGKGLSAAEAMIGAVGEAIERYSAARYRKRDMMRVAMSRLAEDFVDPRRLSLYDDSQYGQPNFPYQRLDPEQPIDWTQGRWLDSGEPVWLPALPTYLNFHVPAAEYFCQVSSNGLAAGADLADATLRAVFELIERDAFMLTWHCQLPGRQVLIDDALDAGAREVVRQLEGCGARIDLYLLDIGATIPTIACFGFGDGQRWPGLTVSLAAHGSPRHAARKAILEQGHVGPYIRRLMLSGNSAIPARPEDVWTLDDHALYYVPPERAQICDFLRRTADAPMSLADLYEPRDSSLPACVERLTAAGMRVAIKDVTSPDVATGPFRVVRALGADIQPIDFGFTLRRLGNPRLKARLSGPINPHPHPIA